MTLKSAHLRPTEAASFCSSGISSCGSDAALHKQSAGSAPHTLEKAQWGLHGPVLGKRHALCGM